MKHAIQEHFCPFESANQLLSYYGSIAALLASAGEEDGALYANVTEKLAAVSRAWVDDIASAVLNKPADLQSKSALYGTMVQPLGAVTRLLESAAENNRAIPAEAARALEELSYAAAYYVENRDAIMASLKNRPEGREKLFAYFGDMLAR